MSSYFTGGFEKGLEENPDITFCIFPYQKKFLVIDLQYSLPDRPRVMLLNVDDLLGEEFYTVVEKTFSDLLRHSDHPFAGLIALPDHIQEAIREHSLKIILKKINHDAPADSMPQIAILLFAGPLIQADDEQIHDLIESLFDSKTDPSLIAQCLESLKGLISREKETVRIQERDQVREMITGNSQEFFTLWEDQNRS